MRRGRTLTNDGHADKVNAVSASREKISFKKKVEIKLNHLLSGVVNSTRVGLPARSFLSATVASHSNSPKSF